MKSPVLPCALVLTLSLGALRAAHADSATWNLNRVSNDWNTASNWTPPTVPNGSSDVANFATSNITAVSLSDDVEVSEIDFNAGTSAYTFTLPPTTSLTISGTGVVNSSGITQHFTTEADFNASNSDITFTGSATAGSNTLFTALGGHTEAFPGGEILFEDTSSADRAAFEIFGNVVYRAHGDYVFFDVNSTAANATFFVYGASNGGAGGSLSIAGTAGAAHITNYRGGATSISGRGGTCRIVNGRGSTSFISFKGIGSPADAEQAIILNEGGRLPGDFIQGSTVFSGTATAGDAIIVSQGGQGDGAAGGETTFYALYYGTSTAGNATLIAKAGVNGGEGGTIRFSEGGDGGTARFKLFGNGHLDLTQIIADAYDVTIGSLEGDGLVFLDINSLTVGNNDLSTTFAGVIFDSSQGGRLTKIGTGRLTLAGANTYTGGTAVTAGTLIASNMSGSATGTGSVNVDAGTLGGRGIIAGATVGTGAFLALAAGTNMQATLTIQGALTFNADAIYTYTFRAKRNRARTDKVIANGVTINSGATLALSGQTRGALTQGLVLTLISNTSANAINGTFANLPDGAIVTVNGNNLQASYEDGDGNDLTLTVVP